MPKFIFEHQVQKSVILIFHREFYQTIPPLRNFCVYNPYLWPKLQYMARKWKKVKKVK